MQQLVMLIATQTRIKLWLERKLFRAVRDDNILNIEMLIRFYANVNAKWTNANFQRHIYIYNAEDDNTPLFYVKSEEATRILINGGADVHAKNIKGRTALHSVQLVEIALALLEKDRNMRQATGNASTPLIETQDNDGKTPLHTAITHPAVFATLIEQPGVNIRATDKLGRTVLHAIAGCRYNTEEKQGECRSLLHCAKLVLSKDDEKRKHGDNLIPLIHIKDISGKTALHLCAENSYIREDLVSLLYEQGADATEAEDHDGCTPLHLAAGLGNVTMFATLFEKGVFVWSTDSRRHNPLYYAVENESIRIISFLQQKAGFNPDAISPEGGVLHSPPASFSARLSQAQLFETTALLRSHEETTANLLRKLQEQKNVLTREASEIQRLLPLLMLLRAALERETPEGSAPGQEASSQAPKDGGQGSSPETRP